MINVETLSGSLKPRDILFDPSKFLLTLDLAGRYIRERIPADFTPQIAITLGSGGLGEVASVISRVAGAIPYNKIPGFGKTTVEGHAGNLIVGFIKDVPIIGFQGRRHYYEVGGQPNQVVVLKNVTFPVYVARALGTEVYFATNAAGGLNTSFRTGDLMIIESHIDLFFPNPLAGPQVDFMDPPRFQPQSGQYKPGLRELLRRAAENVGEADHVYEGVYCALTGPTYETRADAQALRKLGADAVGMSTVPEIIVATNLGMDTCGFSLITNVIAKDGTNATSHEEVQAALHNPATRERVTKIICEFFRLFGSKEVV